MPWIVCPRRSWYDNLVEGLISRVDSTPFFPLTVMYLPLSIKQTWYHCWLLILFGPNNIVDELVATRRPFSIVLEGSINL